MTTPKPTILLVPGAWHSPSHYSLLLTELEKAGYATASSRLPGVGSTTPLTASAEQDASFIRDTLLLPLLNAGKEVVIFMHSYGGVPGSAAAKGHSKAEREKEGLKGGVVGLVYLAAFLSREGATLQRPERRELSSWIDVDEEAGTCTVPLPIPPFYADAPEHLAASAIAELKPHAVRCFATPSPPPAWADSVFDGRRAYILCREDAAIPPDVQRGLLAYSGAEWDVKELQSGHCPQLSMPDKVVELVAGWAQAWTHDGEGNGKA